MKAHTKTTREHSRAPFVRFVAPGWRLFFGADLGRSAYLLESLDFISACEVSPLRDSAYFFPPNRIWFS